jgi:hypothetical protein
MPKLFTAYKIKKKEETNSSLRTQQKNTRGAKVKLHQFSATTIEISIRFGLFGSDDNDIMFRNVGNDSSNYSVTPQKTWVFKTASV